MPSAPSIATRYIATRHIGYVCHHEESTEFGVSLPRHGTADDRTPRLRDFTDGTSNTLLGVEAAANKAEAWTRPGGLDFDPNKPIEAPGALPEKTFLAVLADGSVQNIAKTVKSDLLRRMIQFQDGEPLR